MRKFDILINKILDEMVSGDVVGNSPYDGGGFAPQDDIGYARGDARNPTGLNIKGKKKKKKISSEPEPFIMSRQFPPTKGL